MTPSARIFPDYYSALRIAVEEEFMGDALFAALADVHHGDAREALLLMSAIERAVIAATAETVRRNGLQLDDPETLRSQGRDEAEKLRDMSWSDFIDRVLNDYPAYLPEFQQVVDLAPIADKAAAQLLYDHEVALIEFAKAYRAGDPESLGILRTFLAEAKNRV